MKKIALLISFIFLFVYIGFANAEIIKSPAVDIYTSVDVNDFLFDPSYGTLNSVTIEFNPVGTVALYSCYNPGPVGSGTISGYFEYDIVLDILGGSRQFSISGKVPGEGEYSGGFGHMYATGPDLNKYTDQSILSFFTLQENDLEVVIPYKGIPFFVPDGFLDSYGSLHETDILNLDGYLTTYYDYVPPVPEPATMILFFSGLIGLVGLKRRFKGI